MGVWDICKSAKWVADWAGLLLDTYPQVRKGPRQEICTSLTVLVTVVGMGGVADRNLEIRP